VENKTNLITRSWKGYHYGPITYEQTSHIFKDSVLYFEFKSDGGCTLSQMSFGVMYLAGQWNFENGSNDIRLNLSNYPNTTSGVLPILELSANRFIIGDTILNGYYLIPK